MDVLISTTNINSKSSNSTLVSMIKKDLPKKFLHLIFRGRVGVGHSLQNLPTSNNVRTPTDTYLPVGVGTILTALL